MTIRELGDNTGSMLLKGASPEFSGDEQPDRWSLSEDSAEVGGRWGIDPMRDLTSSSEQRARPDKVHPDLSTRISPDRIPERFLAF